MNNDILQLKWVDDVEKQHRGWIGVVFRNSFRWSRIYFMFLRALDNEWRYSKYDPPIARRKAFFRFELLRYIESRRYAFMIVFWRWKFELLVNLDEPMYREEQP